MTSSGDVDSFQADAYAWLLVKGRVRHYMGSWDVEPHLHLLACGIDVEASGPVGDDVIESFTDTYSPPKREKVLRGEATCRCGDVCAVLSHPPLPIAEVITAVRDHTSARPPEPPQMPDEPVHLVTFSAGGVAVRGVLVPDPDDFDGLDLFQPFGRSGLLPVPLATMVEVFGDPEYLTL